jgi:hypothetical protein
VPNNQINPSNLEITDTTNIPDKLQNSLPITSQEAGDVPNNQINPSNLEITDTTNIPDKLQNSLPITSQETGDVPNNPINSSNPEIAYTADNSSITREEMPSSNANMPEAEIDAPSGTSPAPINTSLEYQSNIVKEPAIEGVIQSGNEIVGVPPRAISTPEELQNNNPINPDTITTSREGTELPNDNYNNNINPQPEIQPLPDNNKLESESKINQDLSPPVNNEKEIEPQAKEPSIEKPIDKKGENKAQISNKPQLNDLPIDTKPLNTEEAKYPNLPKEPQINAEPTFAVENPFDNKIENPFENKIENPFDNKIENPFDNQIDKPFNDAVNTDPQPTITDVEKIAEVSKKVEDRMELIEQIQEIKTGGGEPNSNPNSSNTTYNSISTPETISEEKIETPATAPIRKEERRRREEEEISVSNNPQPTKSTAKKPTKNFLEYNKMNVKQNAMKNSNSLKNPNNKK